MKELDDLYSKLRVRPALSEAKPHFGLLRGNSRTKPKQILSELFVVAEQLEDGGWEVTPRKVVFADEFERFVGQELPMGIGAHRQAMVIAAHRYLNEHWEIIACYLDFTHARLLWREPERPVWLGGERGDKKAQAHASSDAGS